MNAIASAGEIIAPITWLFCVVCVLKCIAVFRLWVEPVIPGISQNHPVDGWIAWDRFECELVRRDGWMRLTSLLLCICLHKRNRKYIFVNIKLVLGATYSSVLMVANLWNGWGEVYFGKYVYWFPEARRNTKFNYQFLSPINAHLSRRGWLYLFIQWCSSLYHRCTELYCGQATVFRGLSIFFHVYFDCLVLTILYETTEAKINNTRCLCGFHSNVLLQTNLLINLLFTYATVQPSLYKP